MVTWFLGHISALDYLNKLKLGSAGFAQKKSGIVSSCIYRASSHSVLGLRHWPHSTLKYKIEID